MEALGGSNVLFCQALVSALAIARSADLCAGEEPPNVNAYGLISHMLSHVGCGK